MATQTPLNALKVFEVAARLGSFAQAAEELHVTPAAVSQQVRALEDLYGVALFHRIGRGLELTRLGAEVLPALRSGFQEIDQAMQRLRTHSAEREIVVWAAPSFAAKWLVPRLQHFAEAHPDITLRISASNDLIDLRSSDVPMSRALMQQSEVDVAIRFGRGNYPDCSVEKLLATEAIPLCSPSLLEGAHPLRTPDDLRHQTLLHDHTPYEGRPDWSSWLEMAGVDGVNTRRGLFFNHVLLALEAAMDGQGVLLSIAQLARADVASGRLVVPFDMPMPLESAYYLITSQDQQADPAVHAFCEWVKLEAAEATKASPVQDKDQAVSRGGSRTSESRPRKPRASSVSVKVAP